MPLVSVIIPAYNQERFIGEAIESILSQSMRDFEILVIDDGSRDRTKGVVLAFRDKVRYFFQPNKGAGAARNAGLERAKGRFIAFLDADDMWLPGKLELQLDVMESSPEVGVAYGAIIVMYENSWRHERVIRSPHELSLEEMLLENPVHTSTVLIRREWFETAGVFDESLIRCQDWEMWFRLRIQGCQFRYIDEVLAKVRFHDSNSTRDHESVKRSMFLLLDRVSNHPKLPTELRSKDFRRKLESMTYYELSKESLRSGTTFQVLLFLMISAAKSPATCLRRGARTIKRHMNSE